MKVATDSCILGAVVSPPVDGSILDIGTGTGLLALMLAQRCSCDIDAVELDKESFLEAKSNIQQSAWSDRIQLHQEDIRNFSPEKKYSFIICNPPFFEDHLKSPSDQKNNAKHVSNLSLDDLIRVVLRLLNKASGTFSVLLPFKSSGPIIDLAQENDLHLCHQLRIRDNVSRPFIRVINTFSFSCMETNENATLTIKSADGSYTPEFIQLLQPYYLYL